MNEKRIDLIKIIENEIIKNEIINQRLPLEERLLEFKKEDYDYIFTYIERNGNSVEIFHFISFCMNKMWKELSNLDISKNLWDKEFDNINFVNILFIKISNIVESFDILLHKEKNREALSILRNFIEITSILFACVIDQTYFNDYIEGVDKSADHKHWRKNLSPTVLKDRLTAIKSNLTNNNFIDYSISRFTSEQRNNLYKYTSLISHAKFSQIIENNRSEENEILLHGIDFLVNTTLLIQLITYDYIQYDSINSQMERKHQITFGIWHEILYKNILI